MRRVHVLISLLLVIVSCTAPAPSVSAGDPAVERAAVERTITVWFDSGMAKLDTAVIRRSLADDFAILEDSVWYDRDGFVAFVASLPTQMGGPFTLSYDLSDWRTTVQGDVAWTSLRNRAVLTPQKGAPMLLDWRETVVLRKTGGAWLVARYQSAPVR